MEEESLSNYAEKRQQPVQFKYCAADSSLTSFIVPDIVHNHIKTW